MGGPQLAAVPFERWIVTGKIPAQPPAGSCVPGLLLACCRILGRVGAPNVQVFLVARRYHGDVFLARYAVQSRAKILHLLAVQTAQRMGSAVALTDCDLLQVEKKAMLDALHREHAFSDLFVAYLLARNIRYEEDLVDQLFNSSEKRLARILLLLAHFGKEGIPETVVPKISQETLAEMIGTTRSRVSFFMNRFRKLGFIHYNGGLKVHSSLLNVVLHD
jgi:CRP-like cAMP-binding protein